MGEDVLQALAALVNDLNMECKAKGRRAYQDKQDEQEEFPREVARPEGLPPGWRAFEHKYKQGAHASMGLTYIRYRSSWNKCVGSIRAAIAHHKTHTGEDVSHLLSEIRASRKKEEEKAKKPPNERISTGIVSRPKKDTGKTYWVRQTVQGISMRTGTTDILEEAIDWHVVLTHFKTRVEERSRKGEEPSFLEEDYLQVLRSAPRIKMTFFSQIQRNGVETKSFTTPSTFDLDVAVANLERFNRLRGSNEQTLNATREVEVGKVIARNKGRDKLHNRLRQALSHELQRRGLPLRLDYAECRAMFMQLPASASGRAVAAPAAPRLTSEAEPRQMPQLGAPPPRASASRPSPKGRGRPPKGAAAEIAQRAAAIACAEIAQRAAAEDEQLGCTSTRGSWLPGLQCTPGLEACFNLVELCRLRSICRHARQTADEETCRRLRMFTVRSEDLQRKRRTSAGGRILREGRDVWLLRFKQFLDCPRHRNWFVSLDLSTVSVSLLELPDYPGHIAKNAALGRGHCSLGRVGYAE